MAHTQKLRLIQNMTKEEAKAFIRRVMGPPKKILEGQEKANMMLVFKLIDPVESTTVNQRSFTDEYHHAGKVYYVHYFGNEVEIEEVLSDDI